MKLTFLALIAGLLVSGPAVSEGKVSCFERATVVSALAAGGESLFWTGTRPDGMVLEIFASSSDGSWTIVMTKAARVDLLVSCVMSHGIGFVFSKDWLGGRTL